MGRKKIKIYRYDKTEFRKSIPRKYIFLVVSVLFMGVVYAILSAPGANNPSASLIGSETTEHEEAKLPHVLDDLALPDGVESAVGTLENGVIVTKQSDNQLPMASITKIVTALVILEKAPIEPGQPGDTITLTATDEDYYWKYAAIQGTLTPVTAGYSMSEYEALQTILLTSSNNMADTLVDRYFESMDQFVDYANNYLNEKGIIDTKVVDATGFSPASVSTPSDLIKLGQLALKNPIVAEIVAQPKATVAVAGEIPNYNMLIEEPGITGIKPGFTDEAGICLLFSSKISTASGEEEDLIAVVMGGKDRGEFYNNTQTILNQAKQLYAMQP